MENTIPRDALTYIVGSDNPLHPDLILHLNKGENNTITGDVHVLIKNFFGNQDVLQLPLKGTWSVATGNKVIIKVSGFKEGEVDPVAYIQVTLDDQWNGGTADYKIENRPFHFPIPLTTWNGSNETVHKMAHAAQQIDPDNQ